MTGGGPAGAIGAVLAGGGGRRMGEGGKLFSTLGGRPLVAYPVEALLEACGRVALVCKVATALPELPEAERWDEPAEPRHPLTGIVHALERAGSPVLVCGADMPFVTVEACRRLLSAAGSSQGAHAVVASAAGALQPVLGVYAPSALSRLRAAPAGARLTETVEALAPVRVSLPGEVVASVNTPAELALAQERLASARGEGPASGGEERPASRGEGPASGGEERRPPTG